MKKYLFILFFLIVPIITWANESTFDTLATKLDITDIIDKSDIAPTIVGDDDREEITNENAKGLEKAVVIIERTLLSGAIGHCSGAMVGPNLVLTAAHCLVKNGEYVQNVKVITLTAKSMSNDSNSDNRQLLSVKPVELYVPQEFIEFSRGSYYSLAMEKYDYGVILLDKPIGLETGWFRLNERFTPRLKIITMGTSKDKPDNTLWRSEGSTGFRLYHNNTFYHNADTLPGNSGGPIVMKKRPDEIIGIHLSHILKVSNYAPYGYPNIGLHITKDIIDLVQTYNRRNGEYLTSKD